jgi:hypothetical protein
VKRTLSNGVKQKSHLVLQTERPKAEASKSDAEIQGEVVAIEE